LTSLRAATRPGMKKQITPQRQARIRQVLARRQKDLTLVIDNIHDPHNVSAMLRSCDAFGVPEVHLYYTVERFPALGKRASASARKWIQTERWRDADKLIGRLRDRGCLVLGAVLDDSARPLDAYDLTGPTAIVFGNEHRGLSPEIMRLVPDHIYIPMQGMVQSLNVSVAAAITLYEAWRQRKNKGLYDHPSFSAEEMDEMARQWMEK